MSHTIYASFLDPKEGKKAAGALLDHGVLKDDLALLVSETFIQKNPDYWHAEIKKDATAKSGITTTTAADAGSGAAKGAGVGAVLGVLGALAALAIPGFGLVIGGGALATAAAAAVGTAAAGAVAGGVTGFLKDQGIPEDHIKKYEDTLKGGGAMLAVQCPSGKVGQGEIETILTKYGASDSLYYPLSGAVIHH